MSKLESIKYKRGDLQILDQLLVPHQEVYVQVKGVADGVEVIRSMQVRGAPLIAVVGCLSIAVELENTVKESDSCSVEAITEFLTKSVESLINARPTAVNMKNEGLRMLEWARRLRAAEEGNLSFGNYKTKMIEYMEELMQIDIATNKAIGRNGAASILAFHDSIAPGSPVNILTHCNTGSLATCGYGTALGVIRTLFVNNDLNHAYFTETRPYNQGSRLTSFELLYEKIPSTLVCDSAVSWLMKNTPIAAVVVGADRVARNGDTANKIGTYQLALIAQAHGVPFYIAAPLSTIDPSMDNGEQIKIEERSADEVTTINGQRISPIGIQVWNPAFDVTPANLITGIITDQGTFAPEELTLRFQKTK
jgi:methylthioribose-1-phosphate isomerase